MEELEQLKDEKTRLLTIQSQLQTLHDRYQQVSSQLCIPTEHSLDIILVVHKNRLTDSFNYMCFVIGGIFKRVIIKQF